MAQWRKVIVSGSNAVLNQVTSSGGIDIEDTIISGSSSSTGSFGYLNVHGDTVIGGNLTFGDADTDSISIGGEFTSDLVPDASDEYNLGETDKRWNDLYLSGSISASGGPHDIDSDSTIDIDAGGAISIDAGAASNLATSAGDLTLDSEAGNLVLDGHTGVDIDASNSGKVAIDGAGGIDIGVAADVAIDIDSSTLDIDASDAITIDGTSGISIDVDAASNINTSAGNLTLEAEANDAGIIIKGDHESGTAIHLDGNQADGSIVDIDAGALDIDASAAITIDGGSTFSLDAAGNTNIDTSTGTISIGTANSGIAVNIGHTTSEVTVNDNLTVTGNTTIGGDLDVNGTLTTIDTTNLRVADRFIQAASGSTSGDGGLVVTTAANGSGSAFFFDDSATRWGLTGADETGDSQTSATPRQYITTVSQSAVDPSGNPNDFGADDATRRGMMHINSDDGTIWIYS